MVPQHRHCERCTKVLWQTAVDPADGPVQRKHCATCTRAIMEGVDETEETPKTLPISNPVYTDREVLKQVLDVMSKDSEATRTGLDNLKEWFIKEQDKNRILTNQNKDLKVRLHSLQYHLARCTCKNSEMTPDPNPNGENDD